MAVLGGEFAMVLLVSGSSEDLASFRERIDICLQHYDLALSYIETKRAVHEMRKHIGWYLKGIPGISLIKREIFHMENPDKVRKRLIEFRNQLAE